MLTAGVAQLIEHIRLVKSWVRATAGAGTFFVATTVTKTTKNSFVSSGESASYLERKG